jgi:RNA polymerase sigma factor (sigma-70 family)
MLIEQSETKERLSRIVNKLTTSVALREDLMQEAMTHLWLEELRLPGQTESWYLQSCKFHLLHYLENGRSIDSGKRRAGQIHVDYHQDDGEPFALRVSENEAFSDAAEREMLSLLSERLNSTEKAVLYRLAEGNSVREVARQIGVSHPTVLKFRRKIAALLRELGVVETEAV